MIKIKTVVFALISIVNVNLYVYGALMNCPSGVSVVVTNRTKTGGFNPAQTVLIPGPYKLEYTLSARITENGDPWMLVYMTYNNPFNASYPNQKNVTITPGQGHTETITGFVNGIVQDPDVQTFDLTINPHIKFSVPSCNNTTETVSWSHTWRNYSQIPTL